MRVECKGIDICMFEGKRHYAIKLGKILEVVNSSPQLKQWVSLTQDYEKKVEKKGLNKQEGSLPLSDIQKEILYYLTKEFLTPKQIAIRRKTSKNAVYKVINYIKEKGYLKKGLNRVENIEGTFKPIEKGIRLHGQEFNIKILWKADKYKKLYKESNLRFIDGNDIRLYRNSIEVYSGASFFAKTAQEATSKSFIYWNRVFSKIENDLQIIILKNRASNINLVKNEYAHIENGLAKKCNIEAERIRIRTNEDNKVWFEIDNSFNLNEAETKHKETAKLDMQEVVEPFFNDLRDTNLRGETPPTMSDLRGVIKEVLEINKETASGLNSIVELLKPPKLKETKMNISKPDYVG